jgi:hypothetical protein
MICIYYILFYINKEIFDYTVELKNQHFLGK